MESTVAVGDGTGGCGLKPLTILTCIFKWERYEHHSELELPVPTTELPDDESIKGPRSHLPKQGAFHVWNF